MTLFNIHHTQAVNKGCVDYYNGKNVTLSQKTS